jgi:hypothetical protein
MGVNAVGVVARGGIEPPTRGFSVRGRARFRLTNPKTGNGFLAEPPCPTEPIPNRQLETVTEAPPDRSGSTGYRRPDRTFSEPRVERSALAFAPAMRPGVARRGAARAKRRESWKSGRPDQVVGLLAQLCGCLSRATESGAKPPSWSSARSKKALLFAPRPP